SSSRSRIRWRGGRLSRWLNVWFALSASEGGLGGEVVGAASARPLPPCPLSEAERGEKNLVSRTEAGAHGATTPPKTSAGKEPIMRIRSVIVTGLLMSLPAAATCGDWPQFRGPNGSATSDDKRLPAEWSKDKNVAWKVKVPGYGWSCPVVWGDKIFVTTAVSDKQKKPTAGFGAGGGGFPGGPGGKGGFGPGKGGFGSPPPPDDVYKFEVYCL